MKILASEIRNIIARTVRAELAPSEVRVSVQEREESEDDDRVFVVTVSIETDHAPDERKMLGLTRKIRLSLNEADAHECFPMLTFIAKHEEQKSGLEFA